MFKIACLSFAAIPFGSPSEGGVQCVLSVFGEMFKSLDRFSP